MLTTTEDRIIVRPVLEKPSDIIAVPKRPSRWKNGDLSVCGQVIAVGPGRKTRKGVIVPVSVKPGDFLYYSDSCHVSVKNGEFDVIRESDVMFVSDELLPTQWLGACEHYDE